MDFARKSICVWDQDATAEYELAAQVTQEQVKKRLGLETMLVKVPYPLLVQPKWVICPED